MTENGRGDLLPVVLDESAFVRMQTLDRVSAMANVSQAYARSLHAVFDGVQSGVEPDWEVVLLCLRHLRSEVDKAGKRVALLVREDAA